MISSIMCSTLFFQENQDRKMYFDLSRPPIWQFIWQLLEAHGEEAHENLTACPMMHIYICGSILSITHLSAYMNDDPMKDEY